MGIIETLNKGNLKLLSFDFFTHLFLFQPIDQDFLIVIASIGEIFQEIILDF